MPDIPFYEFDQFVLLNLRIGKTEVNHTGVQIVIESTPK